MDTNTVNPEAPTTGQSDSRPEPPLGAGVRVRPGLRWPCPGPDAGGRSRRAWPWYFGVDATIVRIAFVVLTVVGGAGIPLYLAGLLLIPDEGSDQSPSRAPSSSPCSPAHR